MLKKFSYNDSQENKLYNNILLLSRNNIFYTKFELADTFQNRIILIFIHISFLFIKIKDNKDNKVNKKYKIFYQKMFNLIFRKIEINMREIGYGDVVTNKNMKFFVKSFYNILLDCENFKKKSLKEKNAFLAKHLEHKNDAKNLNNLSLISYFDKYESFCFGLKFDSVLKGDLFFNYK